MINIEYAWEFEKEFKKLCKKYISLQKDFMDFVDVLEVAILEDFDDYLDKWIIWVRIADLWNIKNNLIPVKVRKFVCICIAWKSRNSWIRIIYFYDENNKSITFVEIYHKNCKENHDIERIKNYLC